jgi:type II secretory pathway pseudopilin PulG
MSMVEMGITMGLIGLGALGAASLSGNMATGSKKIQGIVAINTFASSLNAYMYSNAGCLDLKGLGALSETPQEVALTQYTYQGMTRFEAGRNADGSKKTPTRNFEIESLTAHYEFDDTAVFIKDATGEDLKKGILKLKARLTLGNKPNDFVYNVPVLVNTGGEVSYCSDEKNVAETCAAAQGQYDPVTKECDLGISCKIKDTWNQLTCDLAPGEDDDDSGWSCSPIFGQSKFNKYTGGFSCPPGTTPTAPHSRTWTSQRDCGKKCTQNISNTMTWQICLECPPASP